MASIPSLTSILNIIQIALTALEGLPVVGPEATLAATFTSILQNALAAYHSASGAPLDLNKIPLETPVP
jgi:hypothetical protein